MRSSASFYGLAAVLLTIGAGSADAQQQSQNATPVSLFFRETFKESPTAIPPVNLTAQHAVNPNLEIKLYGPGARPKPDHESGVQLYNQPEAPGGPIISWVWSGMTEANWAVTLKDKNNYVDLSGPAKIRWRVRPRSFRALRLLIKLADGTMLVADYVEPDSTYFRETEFYIADIPRWRVIDPENVIEASDTAWKIMVDLTKVDEIGFTDLSRGAGHHPAGSSGVDWIEVYGKGVKRMTSPGG